MSTERSDSLHIRRAGRVLIITLNRPHVRNALDSQLSEQIADAMDLLENDRDLRAGVLAGAGETFCAGMDLRAFLDGDSAMTARRGRGGLVGKPPTKPLIAAVEGPAYGGGFELALACDVIVAGRTATFALPEAQLGLMAAGGGLLRLAGSIPIAEAKRIALAGKPVLAERLYQIGLVSVLTDPGRALEKAVDLAEDIARCSPTAVRLTKQLLTEAGTSHGELMWRRQDELFSVLEHGADATEGTSAFLEKRAPQWTS